ncbi:MAG: TlpA disulfide reductase family protein [Parasphingorhabdus sp.]|uniref:TlpA family protein disulfide reductase n=1 Tax=Parasphingorhabdus sp. TaxID=2709688 RepID=UPI003001236B
MLLESDVRFLMRISLFLCLPMMLVACDKPNGDKQSDEAEQAIDDAPEGETIESDSGLVGRLDISQRGSAMIDTPFKDPDGKTVRLSDFIGKPVLVNIWATWCAPCVVEMPMLDQLAGREKERLKVLVVSQDIGGAEQVDPFFAKANFNELEAYTDQENGLSFGFGSGLMPTTVLYDASGKEVWRVIGAMDWDGARAAMLMEETLAER